MINLQNLKNNNNNQFNLCRHFNHIKQYYEHHLYFNKVLKMKANENILYNLQTIIKLFKAIQIK